MSHLLAQLEGRLSMGKLLFGVCEIYLLVAHSTDKPC